MKTKFKRISAALLALCVVLALVFTGVPSDAFAASITYSTSSNSGTRDEVCTSLDGTGASSYYTSSYKYDALSGQSSNQLLQSLRTLMTSTHSKISSYNNCRDYANRVDCENGDGRVLLLYTSYSATMSQYNGWNREHVWPQSLGGGNTSGGGADLHHVRPSDASVNSSRGNKKYGNVDGGTAKYGNNPAVGCLGGHYGGNYYEPLDNVKGDVARICLYVYVRWGSNWGADSITEVFQSVDVLLEWMEIDPVDTWEMGRNEVVENIQGNRNVFIDYPEYAWLLFGEDVPDDLVSPSGNRGTNANPGGSTTPTNPTPTTPVATTPVATTPVVTTPVATTPVVTTPVATTPVATTPVATTPVGTTPVATTPGIDTTTPGADTTTPGGDSTIPGLDATTPADPLAPAPLATNAVVPPTASESNDYTVIGIVLSVVGVLAIGVIVVLFLIQKKVLPPLPWRRAKSIPTEETPIEDTPVEETAAEEVPIEETPVENTDVTE